MREITITKASEIERVFFADEIFEIIEESYKNVKGGNIYKDVNEMLEDTSEWEFIWADDDIIGVILYKNKFGKKLVALGFKEIDKKIKKEALNYLSFYLKSNIKKIWMEVSEGFKKWLFKNRFDLFVVKGSVVKKLLKNKHIILLNDGRHYIREIAGIKKEKIAIGNPILKECR